MTTDRIYQKPHGHLVDFRFDDAVADVFPDMIRRSVPGYESIISMLGVFAHQYVVDGSHLYDLGCSLGAASLAMGRHVTASDCHLVAVDNSDAMIARCEHNLSQAALPISIELRCEDVEATEIRNASLVALNFTLQFIAPEKRLPLLRSIADGTREGGALVLSEKICFDDAAEQQLQETLHHGFKRANGYSDLEISQKRQAIENVLIPDTLDVHKERLFTAGFREVQCWFRCFNFISLIAVK